MNSRSRRLAAIDGADRVGLTAVDRFVCEGRKTEVGFNAQAPLEQSLRRLLARRKAHVSEVI
jgi:hypothetical protein